MNTKEIIIEVNEYYYTKFETLTCCDLQNVVYCYAHNKAQECGFCSADHYAPCECDA